MANPILNNNFAEQERVLQGEPMTVNGAIQVTAFLGVLLVAGAAFSWSRYMLGYMDMATMLTWGGLIAGFIVGFSRAENLELNDLPDTILVAFINKDIAGASLFFSRFFAFLGLIILVWITNFKPFLCFITFIILLYRSFLIGINCAILIVLYQVGGIINVVLIIQLVQI